MLSVSKPCLHLFIITILRYTIYVNNHQPSFQVHADVELFWYIMAEPQTYLRKGTMDMLLSGLIFLPPGVIGWYFLILSNYEEIIEKLSSHVWSSECFVCVCKLEIRLNVSETKQQKKSDAEFIKIYHHLHHRTPLCTIRHNGPYFFGHKWIWLWQGWWLRLYEPK